MRVLVSGNGLVSRGGRRTGLKVSCTGTVGGVCPTTEKVFHTMKSTEKFKKVGEERTTTALKKLPEEPEETKVLFKEQAPGCQTRRRGKTLAPECLPGNLGIATC